MKKKTYKTVIAVLNALQAHEIDAKEADRLIKGFASSKPRKPAVAYSGGNCQY